MLNRCLSADEQRWTRVRPLLAISTVCAPAFGSWVLAVSTLSPVQGACLPESRSPSQRGASAQACRPRRPSRPPPPSMSSSLAIRYGRGYGHAFEFAHTAQAQAADRAAVAAGQDWG
eukprot:scaffold37146_cov67-Phaeocystis_antarctica.AAC.11